MSSAAHLRHLEIADVARFVEGPGGLTCLDLHTKHSTARIFLHGAHVAEFKKHGEPPLLFMSHKSLFAPGKAIRGGVPVIFPWFGPRSGDLASPAHGFVRTTEWTIETVTLQEDGSVRAVFSVGSSPETLSLWPFDFLLRYEVIVGATLEMILTVANRSQETFTFEEALHTYFTVSDVRNVVVSGLEGVEYIDKVDGFKRKKQNDPLIQFTAETDRVYLDTHSTCTADDPGLSRSLIVEKSGSSTTVVWNPWIAKASSLPDFGDEEWPGMVCIESANAGENHIALAPGAEHRMAVTVSSKNR